MLLALPQNVCYFSKQFHVKVKVQEQTVFSAFSASISSFCYSATALASVPMQCECSLNLGCVHEILREQVKRCLPRHLPERQQENETSKDFSRERQITGKAE